MWKWLVLTALILLVLAGGGVALVATSPAFEDLRGQIRGGSSGEEGTGVLLDPVGRGDLTRTVSAPGGIESRTLVQISAQVSARISGLPFDEGDHVRKGDVVVRLESEDLEAALRSAQASLLSEIARLDGSKADLIRAEAEFTRATQLYETQDISKAELDQAEAAYLGARSGVGMAEQAIEIAKANIEQREKNLEYAIIESPIDGRITRLHAKEGELVVIGTLNNPGSVILEIADLDDMLLRAQVDEVSIAPVQPGQRATVYVNAYPDETYEGVVERVMLQRQTASDGTGFFETEIRMESEDDSIRRLGLSANTDIEVERFEGVLKVPSQAVVERRVDELPTEVTGDNPHVDHAKTFAKLVFVERDGKAIATPVSTGPSDLTHTVVLGGLEEGETVVVGPYKVLVNLQHDQAIKDLEAEAEESAESEEALAVEDTGVDSGGSEGEDSEGGSGEGVSSESSATVSGADDA